MLAVWLRGTEASPAVLVQALRAAGSVVLAKKLAVKHGKTQIKGEGVRILSKTFFWAGTGVSAVIEVTTDAGIEV